jgi:hypothetical protein
MVPSLQWNSWIWKAGYNYVMSKNLEMKGATEETGSWPYCCLPHLSQYEGHGTGWDAVIQHWFMLV